MKYTDKEPTLAVLRNLHKGNYEEKRRQRELIYDDLTRGS